MKALQNQCKKLENFTHTYPKQTKIVLWLFLGIAGIIYLRLFLRTAEIVSIGGGSGFTNMGGIPMPWFLWGWNTTLALIGSGIVYFAYRSIKNKAPIHKQVAFVIASFAFSLVVHPLFFFLSPDLAFATGKAQDFYLDKNGKVQIDKYLDYMVRFCNDDKYGSCYAGKYQDQFANADEYIKAFETAKKNNYSALYHLSFIGAEQNGFLEEIIQKYNDSTFYAYVIFAKRFDNEGNKKILHLLSQRTTDKKLLNVIFFYNKKIGEIDAILQKTPDADVHKMRFDMNQSIAKQFKQMDNVNYTMLHISHDYD